MSTKISYQLLNHESHPDHLSMTINTDLNPPNTLLYRRDRNPKQARKERSKIQHQFTFESKTNYTPTQPSELWENIRKLKQLKSLNCLNFDLNIINSQNSKFIHQFFEPLKRLKNLSILHFYVGKKYLLLEKPALRHLCKTIRDIPRFSSRQIKLSLAFNQYSSAGIFTPLLKSFNDHRCFTSLALNFELYPNTPLADELISILKKNKVLSKLSLTFYRYEIDPTRSLQTLLNNLKEIKSLKFSRIYLRQCDSICYEQLKELAPILREVSQGFRVEIVFDHCFGEEILLHEWRSFVQSIQDPSSPNKISAQFIGEMNRVSQKTWTIFFLSLIGVLGIFTILFQYYLNHK